MTIHTLSCFGSNAGLAKNLRILEVGFGSGRFLDWAQAQGMTTAGVEIIPECVEAARARGHDVFAGELREGLLPQGASIFSAPST